MRAAVALVALLVAGCASMPGVIAPPARYAHKTMPVGASEVVLPAADIEPFCSALLNDGNRYAACWAGRTRIVFRPTCWSDPMICLALKWHEYAHAWDWPANHPR